MATIENIKEKAQILVDDLLANDDMGWKDYEPVKELNEALNALKEIEAITTTEMTPEYYLFGELASKMYFMQDFKNFLTELVDLPEYYTVYKHQPSDGAGKVIEAYHKYKGFAKISKIEYDLILLTKTKSVKT